MVRVGLGTMMFGWKVPLQEASAILERCMSVGIGVIDTSPSYGNGLSETITGMALQKLDRNLITLATKFYLEELPPGQLEAAIRSGLLTRARSTASSGLDGRPGKGGGGWRSVGASPTRAM